jgi:RNA 2',3'-cyclic 3'-phosphodiesterase
MRTRTFLALPMDIGIIDRLVKAQDRLAQAGADVRWVDRANLHVTVKFLGGVEDRELDQVCSIAQEIASQVEGFEFVVQGLVAQPATGQLRMVWAGIEEATGRLTQLQEMAEKAYAGLGFKQENRLYKPHLTLGRVKTGRNVDELREAVHEFAQTDFGVQGADELIVFSSQLEREGPTYTALATAPLK